MNKLISKIKPYSSILALISIWTITLIILDRISDNWTIPFLSIFLYAAVYVLAELAFRPNEASVKYSKAIMITLIIISISVIVNPYYQFETLWGETRPIYLLPLAYILYAILQYMLWKKSTEIRYRAKIRLVARIALGIAVILSLLLTFVYWDSKKEAIISIGQENYLADLQTEEMESKVEDNLEESDPSQDVSKIERIEYTNKLVSSDGLVSMNLPDGYEFIFDQKLNYALAVGLDKLSPEGRTSITYKDIGAVGGPNVSSITIQFIDLKTTQPNYEWRTEENQGPIPTASEPANKYVKSLKSSIDSPLESDARMFTYEITKSDSLVLINYLRLNNDEDKIGAVEMMVKSIEIK